VLSEGEPEAAGVVEAAIEEFSKELALVIRRYLKTKGWKDTERIVIGGGFRGSRVGELVIGRTAVLLKTEKIDVDLVPVRGNGNSERRTVNRELRTRIVNTNREHGTWNEERQITHRRRALHSVAASAG